MRDIPYSDLPPGVTDDDVEDNPPYCDNCGVRRQTADCDDGMCGYCRRENEDADSDLER